MRTINRIIVHCSATPKDWMAGKSVKAKRDEIKRWHLDRGWEDIGYHLVIDRDGAVAMGRTFDVVGAHVSGHNQDSIGVCLIGGADSKSTDQPLDNFEPEQLGTLKVILQALKKMYGASIHGHNEYAAKACPGFIVKDWLKKEKI